MPQPNSTHTELDNVEALDKLVKKNEYGKEVEHDKGDSLKLWAGTVFQNHGRWATQDQNESGEWGVEIKSEDLKETVYARVNKDRKKGERVQFRLHPKGYPVRAPSFLPDCKEMPLGRWTETTVFEDDRNNNWRSGMFDDGDKKEATASASASK